jgi:hypothetical protein
LPFGAHETWTKITLQIRTNVTRLKEELTVKVSKILSDLKNNNTVTLIDLIQAKFAINLAKEVSKETFNRFIELLVQENNNHDIDPDEKNLLEFIKEHVKRISKRKDAITTTLFLQKFNDWLKRKEKSVYSSGAPHFGRLLNRINEGNTRWGIVASKHLVEIIF